MGLHAPVIDTSSRFGEGDKTDPSDNDVDVVVLILNIYETRGEAAGELGKHVQYCP